jgi:putative FmdB family regulatory protein
VPTYQYVCTDCGGQVEAVQKFTDDPLTMHDDCGGKLRKVYSAVGIVFKGSGFYRTDSRSGSSPSPSSASADPGSSSAGSPEQGSPAPADSGKADKSDKKAAAPAPASASGSSAKASEKVA